MRRIIVCVAAVVASCAGPPAASEVEATPATVVSITVVGAGAVRVPALNSTCYGSCSFGVAPGSTVRLDVAGDVPASFAGWSGACAGTGACELIVRERVSVAAAFAPSPNG
jgi:hypothetical protein